MFYITDRVTHLNKKETVMSIHGVFDHAVKQNLLDRKIILYSASIVEDFRVLTGRVGRAAFVGVACPDTVLYAANTPERLRCLYDQLASPDRYFLLIPEQKREAEAQALLNETLRVGLLPNSEPYPG